MPGDLNNPVTQAEAFLLAEWALPVPFSWGRSDLASVARASSAVGWSTCWMD